MREHIRIIVEPVKVSFRQAVPRPGGQGKAGTRRGLGGKFRDGVSGHLLGPLFGDGELLAYQRAQEFGVGGHYRGVVVVVGEGAGGNGPWGHFHGGDWIHGFLFELFQHACIVREGGSEGGREGGREGEGERREEERGE